MSEPIEIDGYLMEPREVVTLSVSNCADPITSRRAYGITVYLEWWATANDVARNAVWRGLMAEAAEQWQTQDSQKAAMDAAEPPREHRPVPRARIGQPTDPGATAVLPIVDVTDEGPVQ